jgi:hypothetical protein
MKPSLPAALVACLLICVPVAAQDLPGPLKDLVEVFGGEPKPPAARPATPPKAPSVNPAAPVTPPPVPRPRPEGLEQEEDPAPATPPADALPEEPEAPAAQPANEAKPVEPPRDYQVACPAVMLGLVEAELADPLSDGACGEQSPWVVTGIRAQGRMVPLSSPITINCQLASALPGWLETVNGYAEAMLESPVTRVETGTSYLCRGRVGGTAGLTSEHGFANAVDVTGFTLEDGRTIGVEGDWMPAAQPEGRLLRLAHDAACGAFMTVLGPEANAEHHDHLHLDMGCHGKACQTRICQ